MISSLLLAHCPDLRICGTLCQSWQLHQNDGKTNLDIRSHFLPITSMKFIYTTSWKWFAFDRRKKREGMTAPLHFRRDSLRNKMNFLLQGGNGGKFVWSISPQGPILLRWLPHVRMRIRFSTVFFFLSVKSHSHVLLVVFWNSIPWRGKTAFPNKEQSGMREKRKAIKNVKARKNESSERFFIPTRRAFSMGKSLRWKVGGKGKQAHIHRQTASVLIRSIRSTSYS